MKKIGFALAIASLCNCQTPLHQTDQAIKLSVVQPETSKTNNLVIGSEVAIFAAIENTESYFLNAEKFTVDPDGHTLTHDATTYYPDPKQAVTVYAYFPYHQGSYSVPTDQSTAAALQQADACWATASTTPVATPLSLSFHHTMARLVVTANQTPSKISFPNAFSGGSLDIRRGVFHATTQSEISTTGNELIVPEQTLARLVVTVAGTEYVLDTTPIVLPSGQTTTLHLALHTATHTATIAGSSTTPWSAATTTGLPNQPATNQLTAAWLPAHPRATEVNKIVLTIKAPHSTATTDYTISSDIATTSGAFAFPFSASALPYPYTIQKIQLYKSTELIQSTDRITGGTVYKSGAYTFGINGRPINPPRADQIFYFDAYGTPTYWTKGYLIAKAGTTYECMVGNEQSDMGLYFQFGSLIGWNGAKTAEGVGFITDQNSALPTARRVAPIECAAPPSVLSITHYNDLEHFYFGLQAAPYNGYANIRDYPGFATHQYAAKGVGDPCSYYLGEPWRLPTDVELWALWRRPRASDPDFPWQSGSYEWEGTGYLGAAGVRFYNATKTGSFFFLTTGGRNPNWFSGTGTGVNIAMAVAKSSSSYNTWGSGVFISCGPAYASINGRYVNSGGHNNERSYAASIRCVHN